MGMYGGVKLTKVSDIRKGWIGIKLKLMDKFTPSKYIRGHFKYEYEEALRQAESLPDNVDDLSDLDIFGILQRFEYCDCPYLYGDTLITVEGDNVSMEMNALSECLPGISIETWT